MHFLFFEVHCHILSLGIVTPAGKDWNTYAQANVETFGEMSCEEVQQLDKTRNSIFTYLIVFGDIYLTN